MTTSGSPSEGSRRDGVGVADRLTRCCPRVRYGTDTEQTRACEPQDLLSVLVEALPRLAAQVLRKDLRAREAAQA